MSSITTWNRLEPRARSDAFDESLAARVHDPLWFMARQWQVKEFEGEDGGSAVAAQLNGLAAPLTRVQLGPDGAPQPYDSEIPLEVVVEREAMHAQAPTARDAADAGLMWLQMLRDANLATYIDDYLQHVSLPGEDAAADQDDPASIRFRQVLAGRIPDGAQLFAELDAALRPAGGEAGALPPVPNILPNDQAAVEGLARQWLAHWDNFASQPGANDSSWLPSKMEYRFSVAAPTGDGEVVFEAKEYPGGHLDWYAFRIKRKATLGAVEDAERVRLIDRLVTPTAVEIPGGPTDRFWEFEDGRVDLARLEAAPEELARMLLAEFVLIYGNDWLFIPVDLPLGSIFQINTFEVTDTFGTTVQIPAATAADDPDERWGFFHISEAPGATVEQRRPGPVFILPPVLAASLDGPAVEEVIMMRDEMANLAWAVEPHTASSRGRSIERNERYQRLAATLPPPPAPAAAAVIRYQMLGRVPDYWIPLMPVKIPGDVRSIRLQRGSVRDPESGEFYRPLGRILLPDQALFIDEEEVPRAGIRITRAPQYARWTDGSVHLWMARRKRPGRGSMSSGVRFDFVDFDRNSD